MIAPERLESLTLMAQERQFADEANKKMVLDILARHLKTLRQWEALTKCGAEMETDLIELELYLQTLPAGLIGV